MLIRNYNYCEEGQSINQKFSLDSYFIQVSFITWFALLGLSIGIKVVYSKIVIHSFLLFLFPQHCILDSLKIIFDISLSIGCHTERSYSIFFKLLIYAQLNFYYLLNKSCSHPSSKMLSAFEWPLIEIQRNDERMIIVF